MTGESGLERERESCVLLALLAFNQYWGRRVCTIEYHNHITPSLQRNLIHIHIHITIIIVIVITTVSVPSSFEPIANFPLCTSPTCRRLPASDLLFLPTPNFRLTPDGKSSFYFSSA
ncbi:hypothetical protein L6164_034840 [Bauhinia variegata]|uniref:Uncharacterized protein n=1 Tax=Bauhinia variegata TaxID=167791 RepID=A0ACB9KWN6_BAUVA|nr:hypothetical protein L6164_034840 [Bauhinia variegata]